jgi:hypothetical protein
VTLALMPADRRVGRSAGSAHVLGRTLAEPARDGLPLDEPDDQRNQSIVL